MKDVPLKVNNVDTFDSSDWNQVYEDIKNFINSSGQAALSGGNTAQTSRAIKNYAARSDFYTASGSDAIILTPMAGFKTPARYYDGMRVRFRTVSLSFSFITVNVGGLGAVSVHPYDGGGPWLDAEDVFQAGEGIELKYNAALNVFEQVLGWVDGSFVQHGSDVANASPSTTTISFVSGAWGTTTPSIIVTPIAADRLDVYVYEVFPAFFRVRNKLGSPVSFAWSAFGKYQG